MALIAEPRETPPAADAPVAARAPAGRAAAAPRTESGPVPQSEPASEPDHLARFQNALDTIMALPEPAVLAKAIGRRRVDTLRPNVVCVLQYLKRLGIELDRGRRDR